MATQHDARRGVRALPSIKPSTKVIVQDGYCNPSQTWKVVVQYGRQVGITDGCRILLGNLVHLREVVRPGCQVQPEAPLQERHLRQPSIPHPDRPPASMPQTRRQEEPKSTGHPAQPGPVRSEAGQAGVATFTRSTACVSHTPLISEGRSS